MGNFKKLAYSRFLAVLTAGLDRQKEVSVSVLSRHQIYPARILTHSVQQSGFIIFPRDEHAVFRKVLKRGNGLRFL